MRSAIGSILALALILASEGSPPAQQMYTTVIDGDQAGTASPGTGIGTFTLDADEMLTFNITFSGLLGTETAAHIHGPAPPSLTAGIQFFLPPGSPKTGVVGPLTPQQENDLNNQLYYVNIHSDLFPAGEIRGQILVSVPTENGTWGRIKALYTAARDVP